MSDIAVTAPSVGHVTVTGMTGAGVEFVKAYVADGLTNQGRGTIYMRLRDVEELRRVAIDQGLDVEMWPDYPKWPPRSWYS